MAMKTFRLLLLLAVLGGVLTIGPGAAGAEPGPQPPAADTPAPPGIDLIILLDQSGSMSGVGGRATDPDGRRVYTTQYLIDYLAFDNNFVNPDRSNRVVVIGFGSPGQAELAVPPTYLKEAEDIQAAKAGVTAKNLGDTNFVSPLQMVRVVFPEATDAEVIDGARRRLIVVITDGGPYDTREGMTLDGYFSEIRDYYANKLKLADHYPLYVVGVDDANRYWQVVGPRWQAFAASAERVTDVNAVNRYVADQLCTFLNPTGESTECRLQDIGYHFIQPYARTVAFSFFKYRPDALISLKRTDGSPVAVDPRDPDVLDYVATPRDELFVLSNPEPGCWKSAREGEGRVDVVTQVIFNHLSLTQPASAHPQALPLELVFELNDENGSPVNEDPDYPVTITGVLTAPNGREQDVGIERAGGGNRYVSTTVPELTVAGDYHLTVTGFTTVLDSANANCLQSAEPIKVFQNQYQIPVVAPGLEVLSPSPAALQYFPVDELSVAFVDDEGRPLSVPEDSPWTFVLTAQAPSGGAMSLPAPRWSDGHFTIPGPLVFPETGEYTLNGALTNAAGETVYAARATLTTAAHLAVTRPGANHPAGSSIDQVLVQLQDLAGLPVSADETYPLRLEAELFGPDEESLSEVVALMVTGDRPGEYAGSVDWTLAGEAADTLHVRGFLSLAPGNEQPAFDFPVPIHVTEALPYFKVVAPVHGLPSAENVYSLHKGLLPVANPMPVRVEVWRGEQKTRPGDVFSDGPGALVTVSIQDAHGQPIVSDLPLLLSADGEALETSLAELTEKGGYTARFHFAGHVIGGQPAEGAWPEVTVAFERRDPAWVLWTWGITIALLSAAALAALIWYLLEFMILTKVRGNLVAERPTGVGADRTVRQFPLTRYRRHTVTLGGRELAQLKLKQLKVTPLKRAGPGGRDRNPSTGVRVEAINLEGRAVVSGALYPAGGHGGPRTLICNQPDAEGKRYQFKLEP